MLIVTKNKNFYEFTDTELGKIHARIDINTGNVYGKTEKVVTNTPSGVWGALGSVRNKGYVLDYLYRIAHYKNNYYAKELNRDKHHLLVLSLLDRLDSLNLQNVNYYTDTLVYTDDDTVELLLKNFKKIVEVLNNHPNWCFSECIAVIKQDVLKTQYNLPDDIAPEALKTFDRLAKLYPNYINSIAYYVFNTKLVDFLGDIGYNYGYDRAYSVLNTFYERCQKLGIEKPEKTKNFMQYYVDIQHAHEAAKEKISKEQITAHYGKHEKALHFENDKYCVVFPTCGNDLVQEGIKQSNCVGGYVDRVVNGSTYVVFVRDKNNLDKPLITCEVSLLGYINQFYLAHNRNISFDSDYANFKRAYAEHLFNNWAED